MSKMPTVAVAMSGGVDSSVTAALLLERGYRVFGVMLRLWSEPTGSGANRCCTPDAVAMARQVAATLSIPFYVIDAKRKFFEAVVQPFIDDYTHNLTPNPCIQCNRTIRWGFLLQYARAAGADYLATGHYARLSSTTGQAIQILRGLDGNKDQSYVLHTLNQEQLTHALFPLGEYHKPEVREMARKYNLAVADRPDSQDLCFVGADGDYRGFLDRYAPGSGRPGDIVDMKGNFIGKHTGLPFYTIGQRKGIRIAAGAPLYVLEKDAERNTLVVGPRSQVGCDHLIAGRAYWIAGAAPQSPFTAQVKVRYRAQDAPGLVSVLEGNQFRVQFEKALADISPGQAAVLYNGEVCLGGGTIVQSSEKRVIGE